MKKLEDHILMLEKNAGEEKRLADKRARQLYLAGNCARAYLSADQLNIPDITLTKVLLDAESYDPNNNFDLVNHWFAAPVSGYYMVAGSICWINALASKLYITAILVAGGGACYGRVISNPTNLSFFSSHVSDVVYCAAGQFIELYCYHNSGAATEDIQSGTTETHLAVHLLSKV